MRPDQLARIKQLIEQLADRFILEADPTKWPGKADTPPAKWTEQERGDAVWCKKNAMGTGGVLKFAMDVVVKHETAEADTPADPAKDADLERQIKEAQRRSAEMMEAAVARSKRKPEYDRRIHGK